MNRNHLLMSIIINLLLIINSISGICQSSAKPSGSELINQDTIDENQLLYNGRMWRNLYPSILESQFLFSKEFLPASVTMRGKTFSDLRVKYDIFTDEIITPFAPAGIIQLNKQMVDSFSLIFQNINYHFIRIPDGITTFPGGYYNVLYKGKTPLYVRYIKKIEKLADKERFDKFYQINRIYIIYEGKVFNITGKKDLSGVLNDQKKGVRHFIKEDNIKISDEDPFSFIPVLSFIDNLKE